MTLKVMLYSLLEKYYGERGAWTEVEQAFKEEGMKVNMEDFYDPFKNLIIGVLSQNTNDRNSTKAYIGLTKKFKISPKALVRAPEKEVREAIKRGGLYNIKAKRIKKLAGVILKRHNGDLTKITKLPKDEAREALLALPGIGVKTADVFIGYCMGKESFPIDTNINRVVKRIGITNKKAKYDEIQKELCKVFPPKKRLRAHELLIRLGRDFCKARNPLCESCPIKSICQKKISV